MAKKVSSDGAKSKNTVSVDMENPPALIVTPDKPVVLGGNFEAMKNYLTVVRDSYKDMVFSTANLGQVTKTKATMRSMRTSLEKIEKDVKAEWFNNPKQVFVSAMGVLYSLIGEVEIKCDAVLAEEDKKRTDGVNQAIDAYLDSEGFGDLRSEYQNKFVREKWYYNKTTNELDIKNAVVLQVHDLFKEQRAYDGAVRLIEKTCAAEPRLAKRMFLDMLDNGNDIAYILEAAEEEVKRLEKVDEEAGQASQDGEVGEAVPYEDDEGGGDGGEEAGEGVEEMGLEAEASEIDFGSDLPSRTKRVVLEITYPADCGEAMTQLFALLHKKGIKSKVVG